MVVVGNHGTGKWVIRPVRYLLTIKGLQKDYGAGGGGGGRGGGTLLTGEVINFR